MFTPHGPAGARAEALDALPAGRRLPILRAPDAGVAQLVEQSLRKREVGGSSPSTGTSSSSLIFKYGLALASVVAYAVIALLADALDPVEGIPDAGSWFHYLVGALFGALVLGPYVGRKQRALRIFLLAIASAAIYYLAIRFVADGPIGYDAITSFIIAGSGSAVLCAVATILLAPCAPDWRVVPLAAAAGAIGGAVFDVKLAFDSNLLVPHAAWQMLVCLALHLGLRERSVVAASA